MSTNRRTSPRNAPVPPARTTRWVGWGAIVAVAAVALGVTLSRAPKGDVTVSGTVALGQPAPDITMVDFEGERFELSDYEGKPGTIPELDRYGRPRVPGRWQTG